MEGNCESPRVFIGSNSQGPQGGTGSGREQQEWIRGRTHEQLPHGCSWSVLGKITHPYLFSIFLIILIFYFQQIFS